MSEDVRVHILFQTICKYLSTAFRFAGWMFALIANIFPQMSSIRSLYLVAVISQPIAQYASHFGRLSKDMLSIHSILSYTSALDAPPILGT